jgi:hypothetical protein
MKKSLVEPTTAQIFVGDTCYRDYEHDFSELSEHFLVANLTNVGRKYIMYIFFSFKTE